MLGLQANLEIARRALRSQQFAMSVIGSNIANANTPGYSRRRVSLEAAGEIQTSAGGLGTGVRVAHVSRARDVVLDDLFRKHNTNAGKWAGLSDALTKVETVFFQPGEGGLSDKLGAFWGAWQNLANQPENQANRLQVRERAHELTQVFHRLHAHMTSMQDNLTDQIESQVERINQISARLAALNKSVVESEIKGGEASGLRDERDLLVDELSELATVQLQETASGALNVHIGSQILVQEGSSRDLQLTPQTANPEKPSRLVWEQSGTDATVFGGLLGGYVQARDEHIESYIADLDALATALVSEVNAVHTTGYGLDGSSGANFFDPERVSAADIALDAAVLTNLDALAASTGGAEGDGRQALAIAQLKSRGVLAGGKETFDSFFSTLTGRVGLDSQEAMSFLEAEEVLVIDIETQRRGVSGVSLDEEMTSLLSTQHAYEAMIRVTSAIDEMTVSLINSF